MAKLASKSSSDCVLDTLAGSKSCKSESAQGSAGVSPLCPQCSSKKVWRDGIRYISGGEVQRWLCRDCRLRFSTSFNQRTAVETIETLQTKELKSKEAKDMTCQICAKGAKNLHVSNDKYVGTGEVTAEIRAAVTVFEGWMEKEGYKKNRYGSNILTLVRLGADLKNPEDVKAKIGAHKVRDGMKMLLCYSYEAYLKMNKLTWDRPEYKQDEIIPFIPEEGELDQLISAAQSKRMAAYLQTLKETYTDPGEALPIEWKDVANKLITIRHPVKNHRPRTLEVSDKLIAMINMIPHKSERIFDTSYTVMSNSFITMRKRIAARTKNDRIDYIELRSFRHWGGTKIAELSNGNPMTVMKMLGLKSIENAMRYVNIWKLSFRTETDYEFLAVTTPEELKVALLGGYQLVIEKFGASWFRRPKRIAIAGTPISQRPDQPQCPPLETPVNKQKPHIINAYSPDSGDDSRAPPSPSFSFREMLLRHKLAEGEMDEPENNQLPSLWQDNLKRCLRGKGTAEGQMPGMWLSAGLQIWFSKNRQWKDTAILVPRMSISIFKPVNPTFFSFFLQLLRRSILKQNEIEVASVIMLIFLVGLAFNFDADFHELEEITKRALLQVDMEAP